MQAPRVTNSEGIESISPALAGAAGLRWVSAITGLQLCKSWSRMAPPKRWIPERRWIQLLQSWGRLRPLPSVGWQGQPTLG